MTDAERKGRRITRIIALCVAIPPLVLFALAIPSGNAFDLAVLFQTGVPVALAVFLILGSGAARAYLAVSLVLGALYILLSAFMVGGIIGGLFALPFSAGYVFGGITLYRSENVCAYFDLRSRKKTGMLSLKQDPDV